MTADRAERRRAIFAEVCGLPGPTRRERLHALCAGDETLEVELASLLEHDATPHIDFDAAAGAFTLHADLPGAPDAAGASEASEAHEDGDRTRAPRDAADPPHDRTAPNTSRAGRADADAGGDPPPSVSVPGYRILRTLGTGGMGIVYLAEQSHPRRTVALKLVRPGLDQASLRRRFEREADVLGRLQHPGIAQIFEAGTATRADDQTQPYFAMEYVDGPSLTDFAATRDLSIPDRVRLLIQIAYGVQHAHQNGIIHRDLKPSNILIAERGTTSGATEASRATGPAVSQTERPAVRRPADRATGPADGPPSPRPSRGTGEIAGTRTQPRTFGLAGVQPKILDFGVARLATDEGQSLVTAAGAVVGTLAYMSPEQCAGSEAMVDARADVYALGVVAYELLGGRLPIDTSADGLLDAARRIARETPASLGSLDARLRGDLETIVAKAMEKEPAGRYQSASEFAADLERFLSDEPVTARRPSSLYHMRKFARRHRVLVAAGVLLAASVTAGTVASVTGWMRARDEATVAARERDAVQAVNAFLQGIFASVDPDVTADPDLRMRDVLDAAAADLTTSFVEQPLIRAELHAVIGRTYRGLGLYDDAAEHLHAARALYEAAHGELHVDVGAVLHDLVVTYKQADDFEAGLEVSERAVRIETTLRGPDHLYTLDARVQQAVLLSSLSRFDEAATIFDEVIRRWRELEPEGSSLFGTALNDYASLLSDTRQLAEAEAVHRESLELAERYDGPDSLAAALSWINLATVLDRQNRFEEAADALQRGRAIREARLPANHPGLITLHQHEGMILHARGDLDGAAAALEQAVQLERVRDPEGTLQLALSLKSLGDVRAEQARTEEAIEHFEAALAIVERDIGADTLFPAVISNSLASAYGRLGRHAESRDLQVQAIELIKTIRGDSSPDLAAMQHGLARTYLLTGEYERALETFESARVMYAEHVPDDRVSLAFFDQNIGVTQARLGRLDPARRSIERALETRRAMLPPTHPAIASSLEVLAEVERRSGDLERAETLVREAVSIAESVFDDPHPRRASTGHALGGILLERGAAAEAEPLLRDAVRAWTAVHAADHARTITATLDLGRCLAALDRSDEAESLLREACVAAADDENVTPESLRAAQLALADLLSARGDDAEAAAWRERADATTSDG